MSILDNLLLLFCGRVHIVGFKARMVCQPICDYFLIICLHFIKKTVLMNYVQAFRRDPSFI